MILPDVQKITLWTDSTTSVQWLRKPTHNQIFVRNRLRGLREFNVKHVKGEENPADIASRGCSFNQLKTECYNKWFHGPPWLQLPSTEWREAKEQFVPGDELLYKENDEENFIEITALAAVALAQIRPEHEKFHVLLEHSQYKDYKSLKEATIKQLRKVAEGNWHTIRNMYPEIYDQLVVAFQPWDGPASLKEHRLTEKVLLKEAQMTHPPSEDIKNTLRIYKDGEGLLRCKGRFPDEKGKINDQYFPYYVPKEAALASLLIRSIHYSNMHCGPTTLMARYRRNCFTPQ